MLVGGDPSYQILARARAAYGDVEDDHAITLCDQAEAEDVARFIDTLAPKYQEVVRARAAGGSNRDVARRLGISEKAVECLLRRIRLLVQAFVSAGQGVLAALLGRPRRQVARGLTAAVAVIVLSLGLGPGRHLPGSGDTDPRQAQVDGAVRAAWSRTDHRADMRPASALTAPRPAVAQSSPTPEPSGRPETPNRNLGPPLLASPSLAGKVEAWERTSRDVDGETIIQEVAHCLDGSIDLSPLDGCEDERR